MRKDLVHCLWMKSNFKLLHYPILIFCDVNLSSVWLFPAILIPGKMNFILHQKNETFFVIRICKNSVWCNDVSSICWAVPWCCYEWIPCGGVQVWGVGIPQYWSLVSPMLSSKPHTAEYGLDIHQNDEGPRHIPDLLEYHAPVKRNTHK